MTVPDSSEKFEVIPLGTGNYCATRRYYTCLLLIAGETQILFDCPEPFFRICADSEGRSGRRIDPSAINHVVLSHLHGDHCNGLESFGFWRKFQFGTDVRPSVYTSRPVADRLWDRLSVAMGEAKPTPNGATERYEMQDYFDVRAFDFGDRFEIEGVEFETRRTIHALPCFGIRTRFAGRSFGYSCDTGFDPGMIEFLEPCDLIFHECGDGMHTPLDRLEALPESIRHKMVLIHVSDDFEGSSAIPTAEEGRVYPV